MAAGLEKGKVVLLAAGRSARMGRPKQLLPYAGTTLIEDSIEKALSADIGEVIVVLGAHHEQIRGKIETSNVTILHNQEWEEGMASSIRCAIEYISKKADTIGGVVFMVCDQPYVQASLLRQVWISLLRGNKMMAACQYIGRLGTPAAFHPLLFADLAKLEGDRGAGKYLNDHLDQVVAIPFPNGEKDIDTEEEYKSLFDGTSIDH